MRRTRRGLALGAMMLLAIAIGAACTFPSVVFDAEAGRLEGGLAEAGGDAVSTTDADRTPDADPPIDATSEKPDTGPCIDPCDCDKDTFRSKKAGCGGNDCDDDDSRANPSANFRTDLATKDTNGDWNCNGTTERLHKVVGEDCRGSGAIPDSCPTGKAGLKFDIPCGATGEYIVCANKPVVGCSLVDSGLATQECR